MRDLTFGTTIVPMDDRRSAMQVALRVLKALTEDRLPDPTDIRRLRNIVPSRGDLPAAELACRVIHHVIEQRAEEARRLLANGS